MIAKINDLTIIIKPENKQEEVEIKKFCTYKDEHSAFAGGSYNHMYVKDVCMLKSLKGYLVGFSGLTKEILLFCKNNNIKFQIEDQRTHFNFQNEKFDYRSFFPKEFNYTTHQENALQVMQKTNRGIIKAPTSSGKSEIFAAFIKMSKLKTLILIDRATIAKQTYERLKKYNIDCGLVCSGYNIIKDVTISTIQSVKKLDNRKYDCVIIDECFPGKTKILTEDGQKDISWIVKNKYNGKVWSFNENTLIPELKNIYDWFEHKTESDLIEVYFGKGSRNKSTPNHKYYVYKDKNITLKRADELSVGDSVVHFIRKDYRNNSIPACLSEKQYKAVLGMILGDSSIHKTDNSARLCFTQGENQLDYLNYKISILENLYKRKKYQKNKSGYNPNKSVYGTSTICSQEFLELYNKVYINGRKTIINIIDEIDEISLAFWIMDDGCFQKRGNFYELATHSFSEEENDIIINVLKEKFNINGRKKFEKRCNKIYIAFSCDSTNTISSLISKYVCNSMNYKLLEKDKNNFNFLIDDKKNFGIKKIVKICQIKPKFKTVYNISVENNHNYFLGNGTLVSNCHKSSSKSFIDYLKNNLPPYSYGFSASPFNGSYYDFAKIRQFLGSIIYEIDADTLVKNEVITPPRIKFIPVECLETMDYQSAYDLGIVNNKERNNKIIKIANEYDNHICILVARIEHGKMLEEAINGSIFIDGGSSLNERQKAIDDFEEGKVRVLIGSTILNEGVSINSMQVLIIASAMKANTLNVQRIGRCVRKHPDKEYAEIFDFEDYNNVYLNKHYKMRRRIYEKEWGKEYIIS